MDDFVQNSVSYPVPALAGEELAEKAAAFARGARSASTVRGYASDWRDFETWCRERDWPSLPATPETVGLYLADRAATLKVATLRRRVVVIAQAHRLARLPLDTKHPALRDVFAGIRRELGTAQAPKEALRSAELLKVLRAIPPGVAGVRDRAILLVGFAGALRRSEVAALDIGDVRFAADGVELVIRRSKADQEGRGETVGVPRGKKACPVDALRAWLAVARIENGRVFRAVDRHGRIGASLSAEAIADIVKRAVVRIGLDPALYAGHSLRSGFCTAAADGGAEMPQIMTHARHKSANTTARYIRRARRFDNAASKSIGL